MNAAIEMTATNGVFTFSEQSNEKKKIDKYSIVCQAKVHVNGIVNKLA